MTEETRVVPTGRGSYVGVGQRTLEELLRQYDQAYPEHTVMSREAVIAAYREKHEEPS